MDNEDKEGGSRWTEDDDLSYIAMEDSDKDDENSGDSEGENGDSEENSGDGNEQNGDSSEDGVFVIDSNVEDEQAVYEISAINVTLQRTNKIVNGAPVSAKISMSLGYTETVNMILAHGYK